MKSIRNLLALLIIVAGQSQIAAQSGTARNGEPGGQTQVSVITCGPGTDLYATFGHSALRVRDPVNRIDWVYNYGTFDFDTPNFYLKFTRGKLPYALSRTPIDSFLYTYQLEHRWVREQVLDLDPAQKEALIRFLEHNNQPENRFYQYDFLFENCATKVPDVIAGVLGDGLEFQSNHLEQGKSFRELIQDNLSRNTWSSLGIDLALGSVIDREARPAEYMFLPAYVEQQMGNAYLDNKPLVARERTILDLEPLEPITYFTATPLFWFLLGLVFTATITWIDYRNGVRSRWLDFIIFILTGASGILLAFLWFFTDHTATAWNANLLWAFPLNFLAAFLLVRHPRPNARMATYIKALIILLVLCPVLWITGVQSFAPVLSLIWVALGLRLSYLVYYLKTTK